MATPTPIDENPGQATDSVTVFSSQTDDSEMEALAVRGLLDANGIESVVVGSTMIPSLEFQVQVPRAQADDAARVIREARESGPTSAEEAEAAQEAGGTGNE